MNRLVGHCGFTLAEEQRKHARRRARRGHADEGREQSRAGVVGELRVDDCNDGAAEGGVKGRV